MNKRNLLRYGNLLRTERQGLSNGKSLADLFRFADQPSGDPVDMAAYETDAATQIRLHQVMGELQRAMDDAQRRIRRKDSSICEECGRPISRARLRAVPWTTVCKDCKERQDAESGTVM